MPFVYSKGSIPKPRQAVMLGGKKPQVYAMQHHPLHPLFASARAVTRPLLLAVALGALFGATPRALAQSGAATPDNAELLRLLQEQSRRIEQLEARLAAFAEREAAATPTPAFAAASESGRHDTASLAPRVAALEKAAASQPKLNWSRGSAPQFTSADGSASFRVRGRVLIDFSGTGGSRFGALKNTGTELRSVRFGAEGAYNQLSWAIEGDFADNATAWKSAYVSWGHKLFGQSADLTIGNRLNDRSLDGTSGLGNTPFQDRNVVGIILQPSSGIFGLGLTERVVGESWHASFGVTGRDLNNPGNNNDSVTYRARAHINPIKGKRGTLHLGAWGFYEDIAKGDTSGIVRNWAIGGHFNDNVKTRPGSLAGATEAHAYGVELAGFRGPVWAYGEWGRRDVKAAVGRRDYDAYAISAGWMLSGATPAYNARTGAWGRIKVANPVTSGGPGAWELKARYESLDYSKLPTGGKGEAWTVGANWYLNNYSRILFDAVYWETNNKSGAYLGEDDGYTINARFQVTF